jgi:hypothetical protein
VELGPAGRRLALTPEFRLPFRRPRPLLYDDHIRNYFELLGSFAKGTTVAILLAISGTKYVYGYYFIQVFAKFLIFLNWMLE